MGSSRLPGKILKPLAGRPSLAWIVERTRAISSVDDVLVATTDRPGDDAVETLARAEGWPLFRGSEPDVLDRYYQAALQARARHVVRVTADCPLVCVSEADRTVRHHLAAANDYTHNVTVWGSGLPIGTGVEIMTFAALETSWREGHESHHREHVDEYIYEHRDQIASSVSRRRRRWRGPSCVSPSTRRRTSRSSTSSISGSRVPATSSSWPR